MMKQKTGFILALASAAPGIAGEAAPEARIVANEAAGIGLVATANAQGVAAALDEGRALLVAGNAAQAISAFRLALTADQGSVPALNGLAIAYDRLGRSDLARRHFEMALALEPDAADIAYNLGLSLHLAGEHRAAVPWLQRASGGDDGRAAAAARRVLVQIAARLETEAAGAVLVPPAANDSPVRVASARIDMASTGEAVLVLPSAGARPAPGPSVAAPVLAAAAAPVSAPVLALSVPVDRVITASMPAVTVDLAGLVVDVPVISDDGEIAMASAAPASAASLLPVRDVMASRLGALAALTIPLAVPATAAPVFVPPPIIADAPEGAAEVAAEQSAVRLASAAAAPAETAPLPRVITLGDAPPDFADLEPLPAPVADTPAPLRLLDLAALPLLATATPLQPLPLLLPARMAVDWLAGTDIEAIAPGEEAPSYGRLVDALLAQADLADAIDPQAVRLAINRLEALVNRIRTLTSEIAYA
jgi:Flp pilus assembly protein TadD